MRRLIVPAFISLDGVIQAPGAPEEDPHSEFRLGGWATPYDDEAIDRPQQDLFAQPFELLMGRRTYDIFASFWPSIGPEAGHPIADLFNSVPKHVATHRPDTLDWRNSHALKGDLADAVRALKHGDGGNLLTQGSGDVVRQLLAAGLVDELRLVTCPVVLGCGERLFGDDAEAAAFTLAHSESTPGGALITRYVHDGQVRAGTWGEGA
ncbi:MAG TPA: dihydrofolate reductase family protein [Rubricoccaceae bacterium]|nr:dihydrofolate reductase family protein [Rubricoccaceae bacterium]